MKLYTTVLISVSALRRRTPLERKFVDAEQCIENNPIDIEDGELKCTGKICEVKCDDGFDLYQGTRKIKCKQHSKPGPDWPLPVIDWNKDPAQFRVLYLLLKSKMQGKYLSFELFLSKTLTVNFRQVPLAFK